MNSAPVTGGPGRLGGDCGGHCSKGFVPTVLGPTSELCLAFVCSHDEGEAIHCAETGIVEPFAQIGNYPLIVGVVGGFDIQVKLRKLCV